MMFIPKPSIHRYSILDAGRLTSLFRSDGIFFAAGDDFSDITKLAAFVENNLRTDHVYILGKDPRYEAFVFLPMHTTSCFSAHFAVKDGHRGREAFGHLVESAKWVFSNTPCRAIMGFIRAANKEARMMASHVGMKRIGRTNGTMTFNGEMVDEIIYQCTINDFNEKYGRTLGAIVKEI